MSEYIQEITFEQARKLAEDSAVGEIRMFNDNYKIPVLSEQYLEAECCWFFFQNPQIQIPEHMNLKRGAYAISKKGQVRRIGDFAGNLTKQKEYLEIMSEYFKKNNEY